MANVPSTGTQVSGHILRGKAFWSVSLYETKTVAQHDCPTSAANKTHCHVVHICMRSDINTQLKPGLYITLCVLNSISNMEHASGHIPTSSTVRTSLEDNWPDMHMNPCTVAGKGRHMCFYIRFVVIHVSWRKPPAATEETTGAGIHECWSDMK